MQTVTTIGLDMVLLICIWRAARACLASTTNDSQAKIV